MHVDVVKYAMLALFSDLLAFDLVTHIFIVENKCHRLHTIGKQVEIDVRTTANMTGQYAADQPRTKGLQQPHQSQGFQSHGQQVVVAPLPFVQTRHDLDLIAYLGIAGQVGGFHPSAMNLAGCLHFRPVVLRLLARIRQTSGLPGNLAPQS